jgi:acyl-CoA thioesterase
VTAPSSTGEVSTRAAAGAELRRLLAADAYTRLLGIELVEGEPGHVVVQMKVGKDHINFNGACHGGAIVSLATVAFGLAANAYGTICLGIDVHVAFPAGAVEGDVLSAESREMSRTRRLSAYRVEVRKNGGELVALYTGTAYRTGKERVAETTNPAPGRE